MPFGLFSRTYRRGVSFGRRSLPSTRIASRARSAFCPSDAFAPLTSTRPSSIHSSASRREHSPAAERIFWSRSALIRTGVRPTPGAASAAGDAFVTARRRPARRAPGLGPEIAVELFGPRKIGQVVEPEPNEEFARRPVEKRRAHDGFLPGGRDQLFVEEGLQNAGGVHAPQVRNFGSRDRLAVRDDRERLERRERQAAPLADLEESPEEAVVLRPGHVAPSPRDLLEGNSPALRTGLLREQREGLADLRRAPLPAAAPGP